MRFSTDWLAQTKFSPPLLRGDVVSRPRLLAALDAALSQRLLTLLSAPAGYGKTTLFVEWLRRRQGDRQPPDVAWLSLDEEDNDPARFLVALLTCFQQLSPLCGRTAWPLLATAPNPAAPTRPVIAALINDILATVPRPFVLILDDLHLLTEPAVFAALDYLLERAPPHLHAAVGTRHDPPLALARLRARSQLAELRLAELRFTPDEIVSFLNLGRPVRSALAPESGPEVAWWVISGGAPSSGGNVTLINPGAAASLENHFYVVRGLNACAAALANSSRTGKLTFGLVPGMP